MEAEALAAGEVEYPQKSRKSSRKWCYFPELYKMTKVQEDLIKIGEDHFSIEIFVCKFKYFLKNFKSELISSPNSQIFVTGFLFSLGITKDYQYPIKITLRFI